MHRRSVRLGVATSALLLVVAGASTAAAAPGVEHAPRHGVSARVAPEPGVLTSDGSTSGCGAGRMAVNCGVPSVVAVPRSAPGAARHALDAELAAPPAAVDAGAVPDAAVPPARAVPAGAAHALQAELTGGGSSSGGFHAPAPAQHALQADAR